MAEKTKVIGIYGGSFNPIHLGHTLMAEDLVGRGVVDEVWFVVSPQNPLKGNGLWSDDVRLSLARIAVQGKAGLRVSDIEYHMPKPSYMVSTLERLVSQYPKNEFVLIIGKDNWDVFKKWHRWQDIMCYHRILVLPRQKSPDENDTPQPLMLVSGDQLETVEVPPVPLRNISSTWIRDQIENNPNYNGAWLDPKVWAEIKRMRE